VLDDLDDQILPSIDSSVPPQLTTKIKAAKITKQAKIFFIFISYLNT